MRSKAAIAAFALALGTAVLAAPLAGAGTVQTIEINADRTVSYYGIPGNRQGVLPGNDVGIVVDEQLCPRLDSPWVESTLFPAAPLIKPGPVRYADVALGEVEPGEYQVTVRVLD
ncbi:MULTISPECIES: hypothetical protein [unclassified Crossiella]|uniref:hypothetical protein n=1 Tax=unclassified Crossiella TaxID=2620835 RepID=UPI001FFF750F|nr:MULTISPECIES: hypothetical protein [unclassified Crossiella]MCK2236417.1 hypothetical protein [Crossiella sp. S99.2]MCK2250084.1 hypothetical protein [Crossiella sp. S99.1]